MLEDPEGLGKLAHQVQVLALARAVTVATAESCTGGLLAFLLTRWPGSSGFYVGGISAYANAVKQDLLQVDPALIASHGAVSAAVAEAMASGVRRQLGSSFGISVTGVAGPTGATPAKPVGTVFVGLAAAGAVSSIHLSLTGGRDKIREATAYAALDLLLKALSA